jgi:hypothetical protein
MKGICLLTQAVHGAGTAAALEQAVVNRGAVLYSCTFVY